MSHPRPPQRQPSPSETQRYANTLHNVALGALVACPILALLPPRKLDVYTIGLITTTAYSGNYLVRERSGRSIWQHVNGTSHRAGEQPAPQVSSTEQANLDKELQYAKTEMQRKSISASGEQTTLTSVSAEVQQALDERSAAEVGGKGTMSQREAWKEQRRREIQDDLDVGKGIGEMITDQIWEVWNWGKKKEEDED